MSSLRLVPALVAFALSGCGGEVATVLTDERSGQLAASGSSGSSGESPAAFSECSGESTQWDTATLPPGIRVSGYGLQLDRTTGDSSEGAVGTVAHESGKYYFEVELTGDGNDASNVGLTGTLGGTASRCGLNAQGYPNCTFSVEGGAAGGSWGDRTGPFVPGDVVGVAADLDQLVLTFTVNGADAGSTRFTHPSSMRVPMLPLAQLVAGDGFYAAFASFRYGPPAGYGPWDCTP